MGDDLIAQNRGKQVDIFRQERQRQAQIHQPRQYRIRARQVYADLDVELLQPLGPLIRHHARRANASAIVGAEPLAHSLLLEGKRRLACNAVLVSRRGHPFWLEVVRRVARDQRPRADPVSSTGPRMLEVVLAGWNAHAAAEAAVAVVPPDVFYPTWDPMQASTFRERCRLPFRSTSHVCGRLAREGFRPTVPADGVAFTNHVWSHTWIPGAQKTDVRRTSPVPVLHAPRGPPQRR